MGKYDVDLKYMFHFDRIKTKAEKKFDVDEFYDKPFIYPTENYDNNPTLVNMGINGYMILPCENFRENGYNYSARYNLCIGYALGGHMDLVKYMEINTDVLNMFVNVSLWTGNLELFKYALQKGYVPPNEYVLPKYIFKSRFHEFAELFPKQFRRKFDHFRSNGDSIMIRKCMPWNISTLYSLIDDRGLFKCKDYDIIYLVLVFVLMCRKSRSKTAK